MAGIGLGLALLGYGLLFYGLALTTSQHMNLLYVMFHVGSKGTA